MNFALTPFLAGWIALACGVAGLAAYRRTVANREDDVLHVRASDAGEVAKQTLLARRLDIVDRWGKILTVAAAAYGVLLGAAYLYQIWLEGLRL